MAEIKISDEMVEELAAEIGRCFVDLIQVRPLAGAAGNPMADSMARRLIASGWRREAEVLREAAEHLRQREREMVERGRHSTQGPYPKPMLTGVTYAADVLSARASEAEQYVSAGTREGEDQERSDQ
jgi:hypothetical protein